MNMNNLTYAVARASELARESGEIQYVGYLRSADSFCPTLAGSSIHSKVEWWAACDHFGLVAFDGEDDYAQWALSLECAFQAHIAAAVKSGDVCHNDSGGHEFVEV